MTRRTLSHIPIPPEHHSIELHQERARRPRARPLQDQESYLQSRRIGVCEECRSKHRRCPPEHLNRILPGHSRKRKEGKRPGMPLVRQSLSVSDDAGSSTIRSPSTRTPLSVSIPKQYTDSSRFFSPTATDDLFGQHTEEKMFESSEYLGRGSTDTLVATGSQFDFTVRDQGFDHNSTDTLVATGSQFDFTVRDQGFGHNSRLTFVPALASKSSMDDTARSYGPHVAPKINHQTNTSDESRYSFMDYAGPRSDGFNSTLFTKLEQESRTGSTAKTGGNSHAGLSSSTEASPLAGDSVYSTSDGSTALHNMDDEPSPSSANRSETQTPHSTSSHTSSSLGHGFLGSLEHPSIEQFLTGPTPSIFVKVGEHVWFLPDISAKTALLRFVGEDSTRHFRSLILAAVTRSKPISSSVSPPRLRAAGVNEAPAPRQQCSRSSSTAHSLPRGNPERDKEQARSEDSTTDREDDDDDGIEGGSYRGQAFVLTDNSAHYHCPFCAKHRTRYFTTPDLRRRQCRSPIPGTNILAHIERVHSIKLQCQRCKQKWKDIGVTDMGQRILRNDFSVAENHQCRPRMPRRIIPDTLSQGQELRFYQATWPRPMNGNYDPKYVQLYCNVLFPGERLPTHWKFQPWSQPFEGQFMTANVGDRVRLLLRSDDALIRAPWQPVNTSQAVDRQHQGPLSQAPSRQPVADHSHHLRPQSNATLPWNAYSGLDYVTPVATGLAGGTELDGPHETTQTSTNSCSIPIIHQQTQQPHSANSMPSFLDQGPTILQQQRPLPTIPGTRGTFSSSPDTGQIAPRISYQNIAAWNSFERSQLPGMPIPPSSSSNTSPGYSQYFASSNFGNGLTATMPWPDLNALHYSEYQRASATANGFSTQQMLSSASESTIQPASHQAIPQCQTVPETNAASSQGPLQATTQNLSLDVYDTFNSATGAGLVFFGGIQEHNIHTPRSTRISATSQFQYAPDADPWKEIDRMIKQFGAHNPGSSQTGHDF